MTIRVALNHTTTYRYDRPVSLGPQTIRLRPAPHSRTPIVSYSLDVQPGDHFLNWQQDPFSNWNARVVFHEKTTELKVHVEVVAEMTAVNPFDFFVDEAAETYPFAYGEEDRRNLRPFLQADPAGPLLAEYLETVDRTPRKTTLFLVDVNQRLCDDIDYTIRMEPGVQTAEETLRQRRGSCRDSAWLLVQMLRHLGIAARFASGYLIQLKADQESLDGPSGPTEDFTDLHAWVEAYLPGAGWVGLDPTSGLFAAEGHIPLACTPSPNSASPISGGVEKSEVEFDVSMTIDRVAESPRVTKPYRDDQWEAIDALGRQVDADLAAGDVRLTMGGEPTFVSIDDMEGAEWMTDAVGPHKQALSVQLLYKMRDRFAPGGLLHFGQGKWYPGESLPRWAYTCLWRTDGEPIWSDPSLLADLRTDYRVGVEQAGEFFTAFARRIDVDPSYIAPAFEDVYHVIETERKLPVDIEPGEFDPELSEDRRRLAGTLERGVARPTGFVLPLARAWWQAEASWRSGDWPTRASRLFLIPGDSPLGLRLPFDSLPRDWNVGDRDSFAIDPLASRHDLPNYVELRTQRAAGELEPIQPTIRRQRRPLPGETDVATGGPSAATPEPVPSDDDAVTTAMCVEPRNGRLHVFLPPVDRLEDFLDLIAAVEDTAATMKLPVILEGYLPPPDPRVELFKITPDPGVIEVNVQPAGDWESLKDVTNGIYDDARACRLGTEKFQRDGRHAGTGGGNHLVLGGPKPEDSPFLRRPDVLASLIRYWNNHPSLSYLFSGLFVGPTSQAPRVDEGRRDALYELQLALDQTPLPHEPPVPSWIVDRLFRHLLVDLTGNTHRAEFCIDKLYSPDSSTGRLGLLEFRAFEMPPHPQMSLTQQLLVRALVARFWRQPYNAELVDWGTRLHDQFFLPRHLREDFETVLRELRSDGYGFEWDWFAPHFEFRCPVVGQTTVDGVELTLRQAIEPWYVLGEEPAGGATTRFVDSSVERIEVLVRNLVPGRHRVLCNGHAVPLQPTSRANESVAGVRYRAWQPPSCLHPLLPVDTPLQFDLLDTATGRSLGGCRYFVEHPGGLNPDAFPVNALEAESRRAARFEQGVHTAGPVNWTEPQRLDQFPNTLDLRRTRV